MLFHSYQGMLDFLWCVRTTSTTSYPLVKLVYSGVQRTRRTHWRRDWWLHENETLSNLIKPRTDEWQLQPTWHLTTPRTHHSSVPKEQLSIGVFSAHNFKLATTCIGQVGSELITWVTLVVLHWLFFRLCGSICVVPPLSHILWCCADWLIRLSSVTWFSFPCLCWTSFRSSITSGSFPVGVLGFSDWRSTTWHVIWVLGILCTSFLNCGAV